MGLKPHLNTRVRIKAFPSVKACFAFLAPSPVAREPSVRSCNNATSDRQVVSFWRPECDGKIHRSEEISSSSLAGVQTAAQVLVWNLGDHVTSLSAIGSMPSTAFPQSRLQHQTKLQVRPPAHPPRCPPRWELQALCSLACRVQSGDETCQLPPPAACHPTPALAAWYSTLLHVSM